MSLGTNSHPPSSWKTVETDDPLQTCVYIHMYIEKHTHTHAYRHHETDVRELKLAGKTRGESYYIAQEPFYSFFGLSRMTLMAWLYPWLNEYGMCGWAKMRDSDEFFTISVVERDTRG